MFYIGELVFCWMTTTFVLSVMRMQMTDYADVIAYFDRASSRDIHLHLLVLGLGMAWTSLYFAFPTDVEASYLRTVSVVCYFYPWAINIVMLFSAAGRTTRYYEATTPASVLSEWPVDEYQMTTTALQEFVAAMMLWNSLLVGLLIYVYLVFLCRRRLILLALKGQVGWIR